MVLNENIFLRKPTLNKFLKYLKFSVIAAILMFPATAPYLSAAQDVASLPFKVGETIKYDIKKVGMKAGEASLVFNGPTKIKEKDVLSVTFTAKGMNFFDEEKLYLDPITFRPVMVERNLNIFGSKEQITEEYQDGKIKIIKKVGNKTIDQSITKSGAIDNIYGFIYRYRKEGQFKDKESFAIHLPTKDIQIKLRSKTKLKAVKEEFDAYYMESVPKQYNIWFDAGSRRIPLRIDGALGLGRTIMVMREYIPGQ